MTQMKEFDKAWIMAQSRYSAALGFEHGAHAAVILRVETVADVPAPVHTNVYCTLMPYLSARIACMLCIWWWINLLAMIEPLDCLPAFRSIKYEVYCMHLVRTTTDIRWTTVVYSAALQFLHVQILASLSIHLHSRNLRRWIWRYWEDESWGDEHWDDEYWAMNIE